MTIKFFYYAKKRCTREKVYWIYTTLKEICNIVGRRKYINSMQKLSFNTITLYQNDLCNECIYAHFRRAMLFSQVHTTRPLIGPYLSKYSKNSFYEGYKMFYYCVYSKIWHSYQMYRVQNDNMLSNNILWFQKIIYFDVWKLCSIQHFFLMKWHP